MKLESLKSSKFEAFKGSELLSNINIVGGQPLKTKKAGSSEFTDCWDDATGNDIHPTDGSHYDVCSPQTPLLVTREASVSLGDNTEMTLGYR